jgi:hypothetical protein
LTVKLVQAQEAYIHGKVIAQENCGEAQKSPTVLLLLYIYIMLPLSDEYTLLPSGVTNTAVLERIMFCS